MASQRQAAGRPTADAGVQARRCRGPDGSPWEPLAAASTAGPTAAAARAAAEQRGRVSGRLWLRCHQQWLVRWPQHAVGQQAASGHTPASLPSNPAGPSWVCICSACRAARERGTCSRTPAAAVPGQLQVWRLSAPAAARCAPTGCAQPGPTTAATAPCRASTGVSPCYSVRCWTQFYWKT